MEYDVSEAVDTILEGLNSSQKVFLVFADTTDRAAKGSKILEGLAAKRPISLATPYMCFAGIKYLKWADGKSVELITKVMLENNNDYSIHTLPGMVYDLSGQATEAVETADQRELLKKTREKIIKKKQEKYGA